MKSKTLILQEKKSINIELFKEVIIELNYYLNILKIYKQYVGISYSNL